jgi:hypothetical protein
MSTLRKLHLAGTERHLASLWIGRPRVPPRALICDEVRRRLYLPARHSRRAQGHVPEGSLWARLTSVDAL